MAALHAPESGDHLVAETLFQGVLAVEVVEEGSADGLVLFGGQGSGAMIEILQRLGRGRLDLQLILICGRNQGVEGRPRRYKARIPVYVDGFTSEVPYYMNLSDFLSASLARGA